MRLDDFLKTVDSSTQLLVDLVTAEPDCTSVMASGVKQEVIPTLISKDISDLDSFDIYLVKIIWRQISADSEKYPVIYVFSKETF